MSAPTIKTRTDLRTERRSEPNLRCGWLVAAPLWPKDGDNLGSLLRTCDALGCCMAVPTTANARRALRKGNTIGVDKVCQHTVIEPQAWVERMRSLRWRIVAVELAHGSVPLREVTAVEHPTVLLIGHERQGVPDEALALCDVAIEIPMRGCGNSLNVAVAASLALYRLGGGS